MADRIRDRRRNAAQVAERALEEIRRDGAFDYDPNFEYIIENDTNGFNENDEPVYEQQQQRRPQNSVYNPGDLEKCCDYCHALLIDAELPSFCCDRGKVVLVLIFKEPPQYMKDILLDPITSKYSRTINTILSLSSLGSNSTGDSRGGTYSMTINGRLFHRMNGMIAQENGQEKFAEIYTLDPGLATNRHLELLSGVLQNDEVYNKLQDYISKIGEFLFQNKCYAQLLYTAREIVQQEITEMGLTREGTIVEFTNIEPTAPKNSEHRTSLLLEV
ncbi:unnamed protein product [Cyberlindnera jadinii]|uniref:Helitron helicase-like domain-containing protein n=1 Tax=Cyberlindnera jadinii (strain ATCC 18201 / CBS 1600 / BCRC 20928 / JCM 3617 / NBRC 0987 / NRRL Y-1542) TaxID=983966 RepID=A0A0H5C397_CYBJN|nr:hypothetical protein CYBJADRAFT_165905 [Cyberlindnera jadinii NRRL Y-1542]ODV75152.1 hypothetical protein CYBJADRAFT_165905 [Cyberlindnera jadinii NRRL Y-1542]CEP22321.1 unnamed protein product [Cyberlindnera jadinii]